MFDWAKVSMITMEQIGEIKFHANNIIMRQLIPFAERIRFTERVKFLFMRKHIVNIGRNAYVVKSMVANEKDIQTAILKIAEKKALRDMGLNYSTL